MGILTFKPAPLSERLVFVPLIPSMRVLISATLHKLRVEFVLFLEHIQPSLLMIWQCHLNYSVPLLSLFSLLSSLILPFPFLSLPFSSLCFASVGTRNEQLPCSDWMMYEVIRWDESVHSSTDMKWERRERIQCRRRDTEMFWQAALKERRWGELQMLACNNGSRSQFHWFLNPGTLPLGNCPTDPIPVSTLPALVRRRHADCAAP